MTLTKRLAAVVAAAVLVGPLLSAPAAHASGFYVCAEGTLSKSGDIAGRGCTGAGFGDATVAISSGPAAGMYDCLSSVFWPQSGLVFASQCATAMPLSSVPKDTVAGERR
ncbi:hypothetical protein [Streptosporangium carneum]|uniref:Uncharacterized protein n=1 Tax=Streptosporangium carneum TaxID=47481 RepID=A0A9W6MI92_9ACTN|nr:hypothetical protein [Streptosporangium carneum]GLK14713.1 hypothetical protein GCM10017600_81250 [Streptosporangium carneum]